MVAGSWGILDVDNIEGREGGGGSGLSGGKGTKEVTGKRLNILLQNSPVLPRTGLPSTPARSLSVFSPPPIPTLWLGDTEDNFEPAFGIFTRIRQNPLKLLSQRPAFLVPFAHFCPSNVIPKEGDSHQIGSTTTLVQKNKTPTPLLFSRPSTYPTCQPEPPSTISTYALCNMYT